MILLVSWSDRAFILLLYLLILVPYVVRDALVFKLLACNTNNLPHSKLILKEYVTSRFKNVWNIGKTLNQ